MKYFGEFDSDMTIIIEERDGNNLVVPETVDAIFEIFEQSMNVTFTYKGDDWSFYDLCERKYPGYSLCTAQEGGFFEMFGFNSTNWQNSTTIQTQLKAYASVAPVCVFALFCCLGLIGHVYYLYSTFTCFVFFVSFW